MLIGVGSIRSIGRNLDVECILLGVSWKILMIVRLLIVLVYSAAYRVLCCPVA